MTQNDLEKWRKYVPFVIFGFCTLPWFLIRSKTLTEAKLANEIIAPVLAALAAFFYVGLDLRRPRWNAEINKHVAKQIRTALLDLIPRDLAVTEDEKRELAQREVFRQLTGVFWEAVGRSDVLRSHKEHFYSNGIVYSTSVDAYLICSVSGLAYGITSLAMHEVRLAFAAAAFIAIALASRLLVTPRARTRHLELSAEQLELLARDQREFVSNRYREIIGSWRRSRVLH